MTVCFAGRINLPKRRSKGADDEEGEGGAMKNSSSSEQLDADGDTGSEVSSEVSFSYEFAQTEVMMKALGNNGEREKIGKSWKSVFPPSSTPYLFCGFLSSIVLQTRCRRSSSPWRGSMRRRSARLWSDRGKCTNRNCSNCAGSSTRIVCRRVGPCPASRDPDSSLTIAAWKDSAWVG